MALDTSLLKKCTECQRDYPTVGSCSAVFARATLHLLPMLPHNSPRYLLAPCFTRVMPCTSSCPSSIVALHIALVPFTCDARHMLCPRQRLCRSAQSAAWGAGDVAWNCHLMGASCQLEQRTAACLCGRLEG